MSTLNVKTLMVAVVVSNGLVSWAQETINVGDFGLKPGTRENAVPMVQKALEFCKTREKPVLVFPKGRYDFWPQHAVEKKYFESNTDVIPLRRCALLLEDMKDAAIDCSGSTFVFHDRMQPFTVDHCRNVTIRNVSIDWDIPLTAQAEIMEVTDQFIDIAINVLESPYAIENNKLVFLGEGWKSLWNGVMEFERETKWIAPRTGDWGCLGGGYGNYVAEDLKYGLVRLHYAFKRKPAKGNYLVLRHSARDHAGTFIIDSQDVTLQNLNMFHNAGLGILSQYSENLTFTNVNCVPNESKNRILSGHDDGMHFSNCKGRIEIDGCRFLALMDDPINVHGTSVRIVEKINDNTLVCRFMHHQSIGFTWARPGNKVGFIENEAMNTTGSGVVESFRATSPEVFVLAFKDPVPASVKSGNALENLTWTPDVTIKNCFFGSNRARGILMSTPGRVVIENNVFESSGSAILIPGDANGWYESGAVTDVLIRNNTFNDPCMTSMYQFCEGIISICPEIPKPDARKPFHRNIRVENNEFHPFDYSVLYAKSVDGLVFSGNKIARSQRFQPFHHRKSTFTFEHCVHIQLMDNQFEGDVLGRNIQLVDTPVETLRLGERQGLAIDP